MKKFVSVILIFSVIHITSETYLFSKENKNSGSENNYLNSSDNSNQYFNEALINVSANGISAVIYPTGVYSYYDIQSNAVPNQIWNDPLTPGNVHAVYMSSMNNNLSDLKSVYLYSSDFGVTWINHGNVPTMNSKFPSISGFTNGAAVMGNNITGGSNDRAVVNYDGGPGFGVFTKIELGTPPNLIPALYPRVLGVGSDKIIVALTGNIMILNTGVPTWAGENSNSPETYYLSNSPFGIIGHAYLGNDSDIHDAFYKFSTDNGITWSNPQKIWDWDLSTDSLGVLKGISMVFGNNNEPYVTFEVSKLTETEFFPELPSSIRVWSPNINNGIPVIIADENNIPFYPNKGNTTDGFLPLTRPSIGRTANGSNLLLTFNATSGIYGADSSSFYSVCLAYTGNNGLNWSVPEIITQLSPLYDYRYVSISQVNHNENLLGLYPGILFCQRDSIPGAFVNGSGASLAEAVLIKLSVGVGINSTSNNMANGFLLSQNYPNPFNPNTIIIYQLSMFNIVTLKVYDVLGNEVAVLVNEKQNAGTYSVDFDGSGFSSGVYFYKLEADEFSETKRMVLLK